MESGDGEAGFDSGNFFAGPAQRMKLHQPSRMLHLGKVAFEKYWLLKWFRGISMMLRRLTEFAPEAQIISAAFFSRLFLDTSSILL